MNTSATYALEWSGDVQLLNAQFRSQVILLTRESANSFTGPARARCQPQSGDAAATSRLTASA